MSAALPPPPAWASDLVTIGITGTNGKTSATTFVAAALRTLGAPVPRVTTLGKYVDDEKQDVAPGHSGFIETMRRARERGAKVAAMELTSESLGLGFAKAWPCRVGVFTNLTRDHLDAHGSPEHYLASKAQLFAHLPEGGTAVLNAADPAGALLAEVVPRGVTIRTYAAPSRGATWTTPDLAATSIRCDWSGTTVELAWSEGARGPSSLHVRAIGDVFAENAMAALLGAIAMGVGANDAAAAIAACPAPRGRFEVVRAEPHVVVDYAHSPDALARTLATARRLARGRVTVVFGAGGGRDQGKRPQMGQAASAADTIVLTSDNPRDEDARAIARAIRAGIEGRKEVVIELDRKRAIARAIRQAKPGDVIVVAGKGHESEQIIGAERRPFSDVTVAATEWDRAHRP